MNTFEYQVLQLQDLTVDGETNSLNNLGKNSWELVAVYDSRFYFKRLRIKTIQ